MNSKLKEVIVGDLLSSLVESSVPVSNRISVILLSPEDIQNFEVPEEYKPQTVMLRSSNQEKTDLLSELAEAIKTKQHIFLEITDPLPQDVYQQLFLLAKEGFLDVYLPGKEDKEVVRVPETTNIILIGQRRVLENQDDNLLQLGSQLLDLEHYA